MFPSTNAPVKNFLEIGWQWTDRRLERFCICKGCQSQRKRTRGTNSKTQMTNDKQIKNTNQKAPNHSWFGSLDIWVFNLFVICVLCFGIYSPGVSALPLDTLLMLSPNLSL